MIAALSAADQRRRRTDPVETATPRSSHFASLLPSNITITRSSPLLQAKQASQPLPLKKGARTPLTVQHADCDGHLGRLPPVRLRAQCVADHPFVAADRRLDPGADVVACRLLPSHAAVLGNRL